ncbi:MAG: hypothetical protein IKM12_05920 [Alistipes sp.]|nr:hypothetical protein [Alistipes sp.]
MKTEFYDIIKKAPAPDVEASVEASVEVLEQMYYKCNTLSLPRQQKRLLLYLSNQTQPRSVVEMMQALFMSDPRGHICRLRKRGFSIGDEWHTTSEGNRYKRYFIRKEVRNG